MAVVSEIMARRVSGSKVVEVGFGISCFICRFVVLFFTSYWFFFFFPSSVFFFLLANKLCRLYL